MVDIVFLWLAFIGLFAIINPFSTTIVFLAITEGDSKAYKKAQAKKAVIVSAIVLIIFIITGDLLFNFFNITIEAFKIAGGFLIARLGFSMLKSEPRHTKEVHKEARRKKDISIIPLAIPLMSGPGAITTALVWTSKATTFGNRIGLVIIPIVCSILSYYILREAKLVKKILGHTGIHVFEKVMGLIVLVMGIQFILDALAVVIPMWI